MKEIGKKGKEKEKEFVIIIMVIFIMVNGKIVKKMVTELFLIKVEMKVWY